MEKKYKGLYDREYMMEMLQFSEKEDADNFKTQWGFEAHPTNECVDKCIEVLMDECRYPMTHKEFIQHLKELKYLFRLYSPLYTDVCAVNKLVGDRKLFNKIVFLTDISYTRNSIIVESNLFFEPRLFCGHDIQYVSKSNNLKKYISWLFNQYDQVAFQVSELFLNPISFINRLPPLLQTRKIFPNLWDVVLNDKKGE